MTVDDNCNKAGDRHSRRVVKDNFDMWRGLACLR
jgi:hypothetical protein